MAMSVEINNQGQDRVVYTCNICKQHIEPRYHCVECEDYDLCVPCYEEKGHDHKMERLGFDLDVDQQNQPDQDANKKGQQLTAQEERRIKIQRCIQSLVHATHCRETNCTVISCAKMKRVVEHTKSCKRKTSGGCRICQELIHLCCYHAKRCMERECVVPFCRHIKAKLRQQQMQQRFNQQQTLRRRVAQMTARSTMQQPTPLPGQQPPNVQNQQDQDANKKGQQLTAQEERRIKIQRCIQSLVHATHCLETNCTVICCAKMKRVVEHIKSCKRKTSGGCRICQDLIHLCCYHAKRCMERECVVPFCRHIKAKLRQQQMQQRFNQQQTLRRLQRLRRMRVCHGS